MASEYGPLRDVVATGGALVTAGIALLQAWRGRARWEPSEEEVSKGSQKVGGLAAAIAIGLMWAEWRTLGHIHQLDITAIVLGCIAILFLFVYTFIVRMQTYYVLLDDGGRRRIIGGFWLTTRARQSRAEHDVGDLQALLEGMAYDQHRLWSRASKASAIVGFQICYLGLTVCGTIALAAAAIRVGLVAGG